MKTEKTRIKLKKLSAFTTYWW